jgi:hypothetical protein
MHAECRALCLALSDCQLGLLLLCLVVLGFELRALCLLGSLAQVFFCLFVFVFVINMAKSHVREFGFYV